MSKAHPNLIFATVRLDDGCSIEDGEFGITITGFKNPVDISGPANDFDLAVECIENEIDTFGLKEETYVDVILKETGEYEGFPNWHKYYEIKEFSRHSYGE